MPIYINEPVERAQTYPLENVLKAVELHWFVAVRHQDGTLRQNNISHTISKHLQE